MASSVPNFSYYRLKNEGWFNEAEEEGKVILLNETRKWARVTRMFHVRKRPKLRVAGLRRLLRKRRRVLSRVKLPWRKALKRLKNGQVYMNDLFGRNFLVLSGY